MKTTTIYADSRYWTTKVGRETTHKARAIAARCELEGFTLTAPTAATREDLLLAHAAGYVDAVLTGKPFARARDNGIGGWDKDFPTSRCASTGGVVDATIEALRTGRNTVTLSSGIHHAKRDEGEGYCTFNGLVIAAKKARALAPTKRIVILDLDAHCGGGTAEGIAGLDGIEQYDLSVVPYDGYDGIPNCQLVLSDAEPYLTDLSQMLRSIDPANVGVLIYNAGMDPHALAGGRAGITTGLLFARERMVYAWAKQHNIPVAATMAGGYEIGMSLEGVVELHMLTIREAELSNASAKAA